MQQIHLSNLDANVLVALVTMLEATNRNAQNDPGFGETVQIPATRNPSIIRVWGLNGTVSVSNG